MADIPSSTCGFPGLLGYWSLVGKESECERHTHFLTTPAGQLHTYTYITAAPISLGQVSHMPICGWKEEGLGNIVSGGVAKFQQQLSTKERECTALKNI